MGASTLHPIYLRCAKYSLPSLMYVNNETKQTESGNNLSGLQEPRQINIVIAEYKNSRRSFLRFPGNSLQSRCE